MLEKVTAIALSASLLTTAPIEAIAQQPPVPQLPNDYFAPGPWHMWNYGYGWHLWGMFPMGILLLILVCAVVFVFMRKPYRSRAASYGPPWCDGTDSALQILNERFAKGEIQKEEYTEKKATILSEGRA